MEVRISEQFYSLQGEGRTSGIPAVFIRLQACNIVCDKDWTCDTIEVWKKGDAIPVEKFVKNLANNYLAKFKKGAHLIFTGGEPLIQKKAILEIIKTFKDYYNFIPYIEIETNGTLSPGELVSHVDLFNCSFKLSNSGVLKRRRIKMKVLKELNNYNTIFKIVIGNKNDYKEAREIFNEVGILNKDIYLMPAADNIEDLLNNNKFISKLCIEECVNFSTRLQIVLWNKTVGV